MSFRKLLAIHATPKIRDIINRFLATEMPDIEFREAGAASDAINLLQRERFDIVLCATTIDGMDGRAISAKMRSIPQNENAHFILLISSGKEEPLKESLRRGFENYMHIPFTAQELAEKVNEKVDPRTWRKHDRLHIPGARAVLHLASGTIEAVVVNISMSGLLCDFPTTAQWSEIWRGAEMTLHFPPAYESVTIPGVRYKLLRMNILPAKESQIMPHVRAAWALISMPDESQATLETLLRRASEDHSFHAPEGFDF